MQPMHDHFSRVATRYNHLRTTDIEPVRYVRDELRANPGVRAADIGCGSGRYDVMLFQHLPGLRLICADANQSMLDEAKRVLEEQGYHDFETRCARVEELALAPGSLECVLTFNAIHHFDPVGFLGTAARALRPGGRVFVYTRLASQNARSVWGRYFPGFADRETRLYDLGQVERWPDRIPNLSLNAIRCFRFPRVATREQLRRRAEGKHYSTFALFPPDDLDRAIAEFEARLDRHFPDQDEITWWDENVMLDFALDHEAFEPAA